MSNGKVWYSVLMQRQCQFASLYVVIFHFVDSTSLFRLKFASSDCVQTCQAMISESEKMKIITDLRS